MKIWQWGPMGYLKNFGYAIELGHRVYLIDPISMENSLFRDDIERFISQDKKIYLTNTHSHQDHCDNNQELLNHYPEILFLDHFKLQDQAILYRTSESYIQVYSMPGHITDHCIFIAMVNNESHSAILGDTIFHGGVGNCRSGDALELFSSIQKIKQLVCNKTKLYFGHDYFLDNCEFLMNNGMVLPSFIQGRYDRRVSEEVYIITTWQDEMSYNKFLQIEDMKQFIDLRTKRDCW